MTGPLMAYVAPDGLLRPVTEPTEPLAAEPAVEAAEDDVAVYACPPASADMAYNLARQQEAIAIAYYGPFDPLQENTDYWAHAAEAWHTDVDTIKAARCINCAAFNITTPMLGCIVAGNRGLNAAELTKTGGMGYCEMFHFICMGVRRCNAWIAGGPITDSLQDSMLDSAEAEDDLFYDDTKAAIVVPAWIRINAKQGLEWHSEGKSGSGVTDKTLREARAMAAGSVSADKAMRMNAWFARHMSDLDAPDAQIGSKGYPSAGVVAHALWGGGSRTDSKRAAAWARRQSEAADKAVSAAVRNGLEAKVEAHNKEHGDKPSKRVTLRMLSAVFERGVGAYNTNPQSVRPSVNSPEQWAYARVNAFLFAVRTGRYKGGKFDTDLLPADHPLSTKMDMQKMSAGQPRVPAGSSAGGQFGSNSGNTSAGGNAANEAIEDGVIGGNNAQFEGTMESNLPLGEEGTGLYSSKDIEQSDYNKMEAEVISNWSEPYVAVDAIKQSKEAAELADNSHFDSFVTETGAGGQLLGVGNITTSANWKSVYVNNIQVSSAVEGQGVGTKMMKRIAQHAAAHQKGLKLDAVESAVSYYSKLGFVKAGKSSNIGGDDMFPMILSAKKTVALSNIVTKTLVTYKITVADIAPTEPKNGIFARGNWRTSTKYVNQPRVPARSSAGGQFGSNSGAASGNDADESGGGTTGSLQDKTVTDWTNDSRELTASENTALEQYSLFSMQLNGDLRDGNSLSATDKQNMQALDSATRSSAATEATTLYRSVPAEALSNKKVGDEIEDRAYMSTTKRRDSAEELLGVTGGEDIIIKIDAPKGTRGVDVNRSLGERSEYADQHEVLLPRNTVLRITKITPSMISAEIINGDRTNS